MVPWRTPFVCVSWWLLWSAISASFTMVSLSGFFFSSVTTKGWLNVEKASLAKWNQGIRVGRAVCCFFFIFINSILSLHFHHRDRGTHFFKSNLWLFNKPWLDDNLFAQAFFSWTSLRHEETGWMTDSALWLLVGLLSRLGLPDGMIVRPKDVYQKSGKEINVI